MDSSSLHVSRELLGEKAAELLRREIISGQIPAGTRLVEEDLASRMGLSRGPIRHAFNILAHEGLVTNVLGRGTHVRGVTEEWVTQLFGLRSALETYAAELATLAIVDYQVDGLEALLAAMAESAAEGNAEAYVRRDLEIHQAVWPIAGNALLTNVLQSLANPCAVFAYVTAERDSDWPQVVELHGRLVRAIASGDPVVAAAVTREHWSTAVGNAIAAVRSARSILHTRERPGRQEHVSGAFVPSQPAPRIE